LLVLSGTTLSGDTTLNSSTTSKFVVDGSTLSIAPYSTTGVDLEDDAAMSSLYSNITHNGNIGS